MGDFKVLVFKRSSIDALPTCPICIGNVASLTHKHGDHTMKDRPLIPKAWFAGAQLFEILGRFGSRRPVQSDFNTSYRFPVYVNVKEDSVCDGRIFLPNEALQEAAKVQVRRRPIVSVLIASTNSR